MADASVAGERLTRELRFEVVQLALGSSARKLSAFQGGDAGGVIAPVFEPLERVDKRTRDRLPPENAHNSAHASGSLLCLIAWTIPHRRCTGGEH